MKILVSGSDGFIGRHVCKALRGVGHYVIGLDQHDPLVRVGGIRAEPCDEFIKADITKPLAKIDGLDAVIHLAAIAAPRECDIDPANAYAVNVNGTSQVLKMALESGAKKFVFSSSAHVYDIPPRYLPTDETAKLRLNNTYTTTKVLGEQLCDLYWENHRLSYIALRLYNAYGADQARGYFIPDMISKAQQGDLTLKGGGTTKDFVQVDDVARAFVLALESQFVGSINIGTGNETSLDEVAGRIAVAHGRTLNVTDSFVGATRMQADIRRAKQVLGWEPTISLKEGLLDVIRSTKAAV